MPQNSKKPFTFTTYSRKQIIKEAKFPLQIFGWLDLILLKMCYRTVITWYAKLAPIRRKYFIEWGCADSHPVNLYRINPYTSEWQPDPEVTIKHDDLYARAWECEYEKPIFDSDYNNLVTPNSPEITVRSEETGDEMRTTPGTIRENSPEIVPQIDRSYDGTDTDHYMQPDADTSVEQTDPTPTNPRSSRFDLRHNPKPNCNDDYRYWPCPTTVYGTHTYTFKNT